MDLTELSIDDLKKLRDKYQEDLVVLKNELQTIRTSMDNTDSAVVSEIQNILETRCSEYSESSNTTDVEELTEEDYSKAISSIQSLDITMKPIKIKSEKNSYLYTCKIKFPKLLCELEFESNVGSDDLSNSTLEHITKLNIKIVSPNLQQKLQKGIEFYQQLPNSFSSAIVFLKSVYDLVDSRAKVVEKLCESEKNLTVGVSKNTDQHSLIVKSGFDNEEFLHIKWNFKFDLRTGLARDFLTAKIVRADDRLLEDLKPLVEKLCGDKFALEATTSDKINIFRNIFLAIKDADTRNINNTVLS